MAHCKKTKSLKKPKIVFDDIDERKIKIKHDPNQKYSLYPTWKFRNLDLEGDWSFKGTLKDGTFVTNILPKLTAFESMTWGEILLRSKKQNHTIEVGKLNQCAQKRLQALNLDVDEVISLRLDGTTRIYGLWDENSAACKLLWYDLHHGDTPSCVCRSCLKGT